MFVCGFVGTLTECLPVAGLLLSFKEANPMRKVAGHKTTEVFAGCL